MKEQSPLYVNRILFNTCDYNQNNELTPVNQLNFDNRHDFVIENSFAGIAVKTELYNERLNKGVRRNISFSLIDMTMRCEVAKQKVKSVIAKDGFKYEYVFFSAETSKFTAGHSFKLEICDENSSQIIAEGFIRLYDTKTLGDPDEWYKILDGGIHPEWDDNLYKSINTIDTHFYRVQFNVSQNMADKRPAIMPELEIRLYYPEGKHVKAFFVEPICTNSENYYDNRWTVECPFETIADINGVFYAELLCMEYPIAGFVFDTLNTKDIIGKWCKDEIMPLDEYTPIDATMRIDKYLPFRNEADTAAENDSFDDALDSFIASKRDEENMLDRGHIDKKVHKDDPDLSLDDLIGLRSVKEKLAVYERVVRFNKMRADKGLPTSATPLHAMFLGSPGTGKTTVAKMMGEMLHSIGVLSKGHVVVRERASLLGQNYNSESEKTRAAIEEAQGGILFIDEAYQLYQPDDPRDPGKFVIETLLTALADEDDRDWMLILAGYSDEMKRMLDMNPGFKSRIPDSNIYTFDDFTESELMEIAENYFKRNSYSMTADARDALAMRLKADYVQREKTFGNARHVINMIQTEILPAMAVRVINEGVKDDASLTEVRASDIPPCIPKISSKSHRVGFMA